MEDYRNAASAEEKEAVFRSFCSYIWTSGNERMVCPKAIRFSVRKELSDEEVAQIFAQSAKVEYTGYRSKSKETDWCSLIRQKINNLYTKYFDKEVILNPEYMNLLKTPKRLYYQWINGTEMDASMLAARIDSALYAAAEIKAVCQKQKMVADWDQYQKITEGFLHKIFDNCKQPEDLGTHAGYCNPYDFLNEDNFYIRYFCRSLEAYMRNYHKEYYGLKRGRNKRYKRCERCGSLIAISKAKDYSTKYCHSCRKEKRKEINRNYYIKTRQKV
ncbi:MAG: hypothetical protein ACI39R_06910 [Lachnospiraceae bacterium]